HTADFLLTLLATPRRPRDVPSFPTRRSSDLCRSCRKRGLGKRRRCRSFGGITRPAARRSSAAERLIELRLVGGRRRGRTRFRMRSEEHTSELQSRFDLVCRLLLEKKKRTRPR